MMWCNTTAEFAVWSLTSARHGRRVEYLKSPVNTGELIELEKPIRTVARAHSPCRAEYTGSPDIELLTSSADALGRIADACRHARRSVCIAQLALDVDCVSRIDPRNGNKERLVDSLLAAAAGSAGRTGAHVRVLLNSSILMNTATALRRFFKSAAPSGRGIEVRGLSAFPRIMHAKLVLVDDEQAFIVGSPFVNGYWDDGRHLVADPARTEEDLAGRPIHDVSIRVTGKPVVDLSTWFEEVWAASALRKNRAESNGRRCEWLLRTRTADIPRPAGQSPSIPRRVSIARSTPPSVLHPLSDGETEILEAYLAAIAQARSFIYLETQYFSSRQIASAIAARLEASPLLEVILVLNQNPDITAYRGWQNERLIETEMLNHPRVGVFGLWAQGHCPIRNQMTLTQIFVHSKTAVIDDNWATFGTANIDGVSMYSYGADFSGWIGRRVFDGVRNFELNLIVAGYGSTNEQSVPCSIRRTLWAKHLGLDESTLMSPPAGGWLAVWRAAAAANRTRLASSGRHALTGHVLPYSAQSRPRRQLEELGIDLNARNCHLAFDPGWIETTCSPGWIKKVIPERYRQWM